MTLPHFDEPRTDNERLLNLQYDYKHGRAEALGEMYELLFLIAKKTINHRPRGRDFCAAIREQKAQDAATYIIEQYLKRPAFVIERSITGYLFTRVTKELNYARNCDKMLAFTDTLPERENVRVSYEYVVTDNLSDKREIYATSWELLHEAEDKPRSQFVGLTEQRLADCCKYGIAWKNYRFELIEKIGG